jgi:two-component system copper resistance phosphate regulon response regulator CusR
MRLLVIEDDPKTSAFVVQGLQESGFEVDAAMDGQEGLRRARAGGHDLVVLDLMLPGMPGEAVLRELRAAGVKTPVVILTARGQLEDRVRGLQLGADDYLAKPFAFVELLARIRAVLRRGPPSAGGAGAVPVFRIADLVLELSPRAVRRGEQKVDLTPKEFALLELLVRHAGEPLTRAFIAEKVWEMTFDSGTNVVDVHIRRLRAKVDEPFEPRLIHTVRGVGYVLEHRRDEPDGGASSAPPGGE